MYLYYALYVKLNYRMEIIFIALFVGFLKVWLVRL
jgi:hypothetical protein